MVGPVSGMSPSVSFVIPCGALMRPLPSMSAINIFSLFFSAFRLQPDLNALRPPLPSPARKGSPMHPNDDDAISKAKLYLFFASAAAALAHSGPPGRYDAERAQ